LIEWRSAVGRADNIERGERKEEEEEMRRGEKVGSKREKR